MEKLSEELLLALAVKNSGGGGGGTTNYNDLDNLPQIGGVTLQGNKTASDLGLVAAENGKSLSTNDYDNAEKQKNADNATAVSAIKGDIAPNFNATASYAVDDYVLKDGVLYKCTTAHTGAWDANDFTATTVSDEITEVADAVDDIKDGASIDSFADVETALAGKQGTLTFDNTPTENSTNPVKSGGIYSALAGKADTGIVADDFDSTASYVIGNYCIENGKLYRFKANHSGAWSASDVDEIQITGELATLKSGLTNVNSNLASLGLSVVNGRLCQTYSV